MKPCLNITNPKIVSRVIIILTHFTNCRIDDSLGRFFTRRPPQPTNTHYKAANIDNDNSGAELAV